MNKFNEKPGDDTGMQTRVWGPAGWLFLHCIAQNYPWKPTPLQKNEYLMFFKTTGSVLPCRYCRESYQKYITGIDNWKKSAKELENPDILSEEDSSLILNISKLESRKTLVTWLYNLHNRINKKLGITQGPTLEEVCDKYESFRSKCIKSKKVVKPKKGCLDPMNGARKRCVVKVVNCDENGKLVSFGRVKIKLLSIKKSNRSGKKLMATFETNGRKKVIHFGQAGAGDMTKHKNIQRRNRYIFRHYKDLKTKNPTKAGYLSMFVLWNKPTIASSISDYRRRLNIFNKTGKFPTKIPGYKSPGKKSKYQ